MEASPQTAVPVDSAERHSDGASEPCPVPLDWRQVRAAFRAEPQWECPFRDSVIRGRQIGSGPALYFANGMVGSSELFCLTAWLLKDEFRCVVFDPPAKSMRSVSDHTDALKTVLANCGDESAFVYATSFGCVPTIAALADDEQRFPAAILQGGYATLNMTLSERILAAVGRIANSGVARIPFQRTIAEQNHRPWFPPFDFSRWEFFEEDSGRTLASEIAQRALAASKFDGENQLSNIRSRVLLLQSEGDGQKLRECHTVLKNGIARAETEEMLTCGRLPFLTHPHRLAKIIRRFFLGEESSECSPETCDSFGTEGCNSVSTLNPAAAETSGTDEKGLDG